MSLMRVLYEYDKEREARITKLEADNERLRQKIRQMTDEALRCAEANSAALLRNILSGAIVKPTSPEFLAETVEAR